MINNIKYLAASLVLVLTFSCSGGNNDTSDIDTDTISPGPVSEMDRSRYNLNEPDEMLHEMQDSAGIGTAPMDSAEKNKTDTLD